MAFKQIRALLVRYSPRTVKVKHVDVAPQKASAPGPGALTIRRCSSSLDGGSAAESIVEDEEILNGEPPKLPLLDFSSKHDQGSPVTPGASQERAGNPTRSRRGVRTDATGESARLRVINYELAGHLQKAEQDLSRKHITIAEMEDELETLWETTSEHQMKRLELEEENTRLSALIQLPSTSKWRPMRQLKERLLAMDARAKLAESQVSEMKIVLADAVKERKELREEAFELWDAILKTGEQHQAPDRADRAMNRLSVRFEFEGARV